MHVSLVTSQNLTCGTQHAAKLSTGARLLARHPQRKKADKKNGKRTIEGHARVVNTVVNIPLSRTTC